MRLPRLSRLLDPLRYRLILLKRHARLSLQESARCKGERAFAALCAEAKAGGGIFRDCHQFN